MRITKITIWILVILACFIFVVLYSKRHAKQPVIGIGASLAVRQNSLEILGVMANSPAEKAGLHAGLIIQTIDGHSVAAKPLSVCIAIIRGSVGSKVVLEVVDPVNSTTNQVEVVREKFLVPAPSGKSITLPVKP